MIPPHIDTALVARLAVVRREIPRDGERARAAGRADGAGGRRGGAPRGGDARTFKIAVTSADEFGVERGACPYA